MLLPIGIDNFRELVENNYYLVDKSLFIEEVFEQGPKVQLITRPRRFGKTLNMSMLFHFVDIDGDHANLFKGLKIEERPCFEKLGQHPVIFISFKDLKSATFEGFLSRFAEEVAELYKKHLYLLENLYDLDGEIFREIAQEKADQSRLSSALSRLTRLLFEYHNSPVVLLIDEYDSPIHDAYNQNFYKPMIRFMQVALSKLLKGNDAIEKAVLTGILRVGKESIFSGLNHVRVYSLLDQAFCDKFGFSEDEVIQLLSDAKMSHRQEEVRHWYNGYRMFGTVIYNPWSVINLVDQNPKWCRPYWVNTSSNELIRDCLQHGTTIIHERLIQLIKGEVLPVEVADYTVLRDLETDGQMLWSLLLYSGYLTAVDHEDRSGVVYHNLAIPNKEVMYLYRRIFRGWLQRQEGDDSMPELFTALVQGDMLGFEFHLQKIVSATLSFYDTAGKDGERFYHAFILGLLAHYNETYQVRSNRESGYGRYDVMLIPKNREEPGAVLEFKMADSLESLDQALQDGLCQIRDRSYATELVEVGVKQIQQVAIACYGKYVKVQAAS